jgi:predicted TIM-barrel fold metal-dependent hydrolase
MSAEELVKAMDRCGVDKIVNLDGNPEIFEKYNKEFKEKYPSRFVMFAVLNWQEVAKPYFIKNQLELLTNMVNNGAKGLKVYKSFGLKIRDQSGNIVHIDDSRLDPIWERAGELKLPVLIHLSDPTPFFTPIDRYNERLEELQEFPQWSFFGPEFPKKETLLERGENLLKKHPRTNFILAHMADIPENLSHLGTLLNKYPNLYLDMSSRVPELGRQPYTAREFFIHYQDRVLFGTDGGYALDENGLWPAERYFRTNFEFLETTNEYFEYPLWGINKQGRWRVYGIGLPDKVLEKIYYKNAKNLLKIND